MSWKVLCFVCIKFEISRGWLTAQQKEPEPPKLTLVHHTEQINVLKVVGREGGETSGHNPLKGKQVDWKPAGWTEDQFHSASI